LNTGKVRCRFGFVVAPFTPDFSLAILPETPSAPEMLAPDLPDTIFHPPA
jgi:hypothetical protein